MENYVRTDIKEISGILKSLTIKEQLEFDENYRNEEKDRKYSNF